MSALPPQQQKEDALSYARIRQAFDEQPLFEDKSWQLSPEAWPLTPDQRAELEAIGQACLEFHIALERLYLRARECKNLLRNRQFRAPWVAEYLDRGKPEGLLEHACEAGNRGALPTVIRPDLLQVEGGYALTEMDSVPGGIGLTAFLNRLYESSGSDVVGAGDAMIEGFYASLARLSPEKRLPLIAIAVSEEAATYRPEMRWLAETLQRAGKRVFCVRPEELTPLGDTLCIPIEGNPEQVDLLYRFFELFDLPQIPVAESILQAWREGQLKLAPPMRPFQEEKLALALFHHHLLGSFWRENLSRQALKVLKQVIPKTWIMDPVDLPPNAVLDAPTVGGQPIARWEQLGEATQKERSLIIKISGFHERAWGARSVTFGSDVSSAQWREAIEEAVREADRNLYILQEYRKPVRLRHPVFADPETLQPMEGRVRLTPFYFVQSSERVSLDGVLATFCPADKKIIHGMRDAAMLPARVVGERAEGHRSD